MSVHKLREPGNEATVCQHIQCIYCVQYLYYRAVDDKISNAAFGGVEESGIGGVGAVTLTSSDRRLGIVAATCSGNTFSFTIMCVEHVYTM